MACLIPLILMGQNSKTKKLLSEIEGEWKLNENDELAYQIIIDSLPGNKEDNYLKVKSFLADLNDADMIVLDDNKEDGFVIAKGVHKDVFKGVFNMEWSNFDVMFTIKVNLKNHRVRMICRLDKYVNNMSSGNLDGSALIVEANVVEEYPVNKDVRWGFQKNSYGQTFYHSHLYINSLMGKFERSLTKIQQDSDW